MINKTFSENELITAQDLNDIINEQNSKITNLLITTSEAEFEVTKQSANTKDIYYVDLLNNNYLKYVYTGTDYAGIYIAYQTSIYPLHISVRRDSEYATEKVRHVLYYYDIYDSARNIVRWKNIDNSATFYTFGIRPEIGTYIFNDPNLEEQAYQVSEHSEVYDLSTLLTSARLYFNDITQKLYCYDPQGAVTKLVNLNSAGTFSYYLPGLVSTGALSFNGIKTFTDNIYPADSSLYIGTDSIPVDLYANDIYVKLDLDLILNILTLSNNTSININNEINTKYNYYKCAGNIEVDVKVEKSDFNYAKDFYYTFENTSNSNATINIAVKDNNIHLANMYKNSISIAAGLILELAFTFWGGAFCTVSGGLK